MTNSEKLGYFTNGQTAAAKKWAKAELNKILPILQAAHKNIHIWWCAYHCGKEEELYYKLEDYAVRLMGVIDSWLAINEDEELMSQFEKSEYACF